ncbi:DsbA family protein [Enterococcus sp. LJL99]
MIEIYLFVNPLGNICLNLEKELLKFIETQNKKIQFRFIPFVNMKTIDRLMKTSNSNDIDERNNLFENIYSAALDYKAAQLQGKKKGRHLLLGLQKANSVDHIPYSPELSETLLVESGGDLDMFRSDRQSNFVKESFQTDQQIAREMGIVTHPSAVVYNYACERDFGVLVENCRSVEDIKRLCETKKDKLCVLSENFSLYQYSDQEENNKHLHLL